MRVIGLLRDGRLKWIARPSHKVCLELGMLSCWIDSHPACVSFGAAVVRRLPDCEACYLAAAIPLDLFLHPSIHESARAAARPFKEPIMATDLRLKENL